MCFGFGARKIWDRIQTIRFRGIPKASRALSTGGALLRTSNFCFSEGPLVRWGGGPEFKDTVEL